MFSFLNVKIVYAKYGVDACFTIRFVSSAVAEAEGYKKRSSVIICTPARLEKKLESFPAGGNSKRGWHRLMTHAHPVRHQEAHH